MQSDWLDTLSTQPRLKASAEATVSSSSAERGRTNHVSSTMEPSEKALTPWQQQVQGVVLGAAIGDAMGHPTEFLSMTSIRERWGDQGVQGFELYWDQPEGRVAPYTDDTQMAEAVLRSIVEHHAESESHHVDALMRRMSKAFVEWSVHPQGGHRAPGNACLSGCRALANGVPWFEAGGPTAGGCGSVMRAYPFGIAYVSELSKAEEYAVLHSKLTHRDPIALAASASMAVGVALALRHASVREICTQMIAAAARYSSTTGTMVAQAYEDARRGVEPSKTLDRLRAWAAHEAIAAAVYIFARHPNDARAAILEGANTPGDSDSIATLAGALVGARVGVAGLPAEWVRDIERSEELKQLAVLAAGLIE